MGKKENLKEKIHRAYLSSLRASLFNKRNKLAKLEQKILALEVKLKKHGGWYG